MEPAVYLVRGLDGSLAPRESYYSEVAHDQLSRVEPEYRSRTRRGLGQSRTSDVPPLKVNFDAHPWGGPCEQANSARGAASLTWWPLSGDPSYFGRHGVSDRLLDCAPPRFTATAHDGRCIVEWRHPTAQSPLPGQARYAELVHGARFRHLGSSYTVWAEPRETWSRDEAATPSDSQLLDELGRLGTAALEEGAKRFLALPRVSRWWGEEFIRLTGLAPSRSDAVHHAEWKEITPVFGGYVLRWVVVAEGCEALGIFRTLRGADLITLRDAATLLHELAVMPEYEGPVIPLPPIPRIEEELAFLQVERELLDDPIKRNQLRHRIRELGRMLTLARERAARDAAAGGRTRAIFCMPLVFDGRGGVYSAGRFRRPDAVESRDSTARGAPP